jgi:LmbE family N-acetylglucosaminyl deacetylase
VFIFGFNYCVDTSFLEVINRKNKTFITGGDKNYLPLVEILYDSIKNYLTESDFIVYTFNCDYEIKGVETRRINLPVIPSRPQGKYPNLAWNDNSLYWGKYYATIDALKDYDFVSWIDGDAFATEYINEIWNYTDFCSKHVQPLFMHYFFKDIATWKDDHGVRIEGKFGAEAAYNFGTKRNPYMKIAAAGLYLAHKNHTQFFKDCIDMWYKSMKMDCYVYCDRNAYSEERLTNVYTWMKKTNGFLPITWVNRDNKPGEDYWFRDEKIYCFLQKQTDVIFNIDTRNPLMIHQFPNPKDMTNMYSAYKQTPDKIMFVAHPDDELLFGGIALLEEQNWKVVCLTNQNNDTRRFEFGKSMRDLAVPLFKMYDLKDDINTPLDNQRLEEIIKNEMNSQKWTKVVTHNNIGEYGHPHHKQVHDTVRKILNNDDMLWVFDKDETYNNQTIVKEKTDIFLNRYKSQKDILNQIKGQYDGWFKDKFMNSNYIEHGVIKPFNKSSYKEDQFIHCFNK